jgi:hypothetical protein
MAIWPQLLRRRIAGAGNGGEGEQGEGEMQRSGRQKPGFVRGRREGNGIARELSRGLGELMELQIVHVHVFGIK